MKGVTVSTLPTGRLAVVTPFVPAWPAEAKKLGGRWSKADGAWTFDARDDGRVRRLLLTTFGTDGSGVPVDTCTVHVQVGALHNATGRRSQTFALLGRELVRRQRQDSQPRLGHGVHVVSGGFLPGTHHGLQPDFGPTNDLVLAVSHVPRALAEKALAVHPAFLRLVPSATPEPTMPKTPATVTTTTSKKATKKPDLRAIAERLRERLSGDGRLNLDDASEEFHLSHQDLKKVLAWVRHELPPMRLTEDETVAFLPSETTTLSHTTGASLDSEDEVVTSAPAQLTLPAQDDTFDPDVDAPVDTAPVAVDPPTHPPVDPTPVADPGQRRTLTKLAVALAKMAATFPEHSTAREQLEQAAACTRCALKVVAPTVSVQAPSAPAQTPAPAAERGLVVGMSVSIVPRKRAYYEGTLAQDDQTGLVVQQVVGNRVKVRSQKGELLVLPARHLSKKC